MKTILQVEDDPNDVFFFQRAVRKAEVATSIQVANNGQEALNPRKHPSSSSAPFFTPTRSHLINTRGGAACLLAEDFVARRSQPAAGMLPPRASSPAKIPRRAIRSYL